MYFSFFCIFVFPNLKVCCSTALRVEHCTCSFAFGNVSLPSMVQFVLHTQHRDFIAFGRKFSTRNKQIFGPIFHIFMHSSDLHLRLVLQLFIAKWTKVASSVAVSAATNAKDWAGYQSREWVGQELHLISNFKNNLQRPKPLISDLNWNELRHSVVFVIQPYLIKFTRRTTECQSLTHTEKRETPKKGSR